MQEASQALLVLVAFEALLLVCRSYGWADPLASWLETYHELHEYARQVRRGHGDGHMHYVP